MRPRSVVSRISSVEIPSTPKKYWTPIEGIQGAFSTNWKPSRRAVEPEPERQAHQEAEEAEAVRHPAHRVLLLLAGERGQEEDEGAHEGRVGDDGEEVLPVEVHAL